MGPVASGAARAGHGLALLADGAGGRDDLAADLGFRLDLDVGGRGRRRRGPLARMVRGVARLPAPGLAGQDQLRPLHVSRGRALAAPGPLLPAPLVSEQGPAADHRHVRRDGRSRGPLLLRLRAAVLGAQAPLDAGPVATRVRAWLRQTLAIAVDRPFPNHAPSLKNLRSREVGI